MKLIILFDLIFLVSTFFISLLSTLISLPLIIRFALKRNLLDFTDVRKQSRKPLPRIGGLGIFLAILISLSILIMYKNLDLEIDNLRGFLIYSIGFFLIGFIDDLFNISPWPRLSIQVALAALSWLQNLRIEAIDLTYLNIGTNYFVLPQYLSFILTIVWIVGLTNAINWIDGLDGLAAGVAIIGLTGLLIINFKLGKFDIFYILLPILASCLAFIKYNFYPAKIIMGDGGSYMLGFMLASLSVISITKYPSELSGTSATAIYIPIMLFFIPILDMVSVIIYRVLDGRSPFFPDKIHLHHRLMARGISHRDTVLLIYLFSVFATSISISFIL